MIKAVIKTDERAAVILGITEENVARMKQDDPIVFNLRDLKLEDEWVVVAVKREDGTAGVPADLESFIGLVFSEAVIESLRGSPARIKPRDDLEFVVVVGDQDDMQHQLGQFIGPDTIVEDTRPASDRPPSRN